MQDNFTIHSRYVGNEDREKRNTLPLVDRLDPALGEATSGIGAMLTELIRRTLRGGVQRVDEELQSVVDEKVDDAVIIRLPAIEEAAIKTAESTARTVSTAAVATLELETRETALKLRTSIEESERRAAEAARALVTTEVQDLERRADVAVRSLVEVEIHSLEQRSDAAVRDLVDKEILDLEKRADATTRELVGDEIRTLAERTGSQIQAEIAQVEQRATTATREVVAREITELEQRAEARARELMTGELDVLKQKSKSTVETLNKHLNSLNDQLQALKKELAAEKQSREQSLALVQAEYRRGIDTVRQAFGEHLKKQAGQAETRHREMNASYEDLLARVTELEKPRGLRALWIRLFGKKKQAA